PIEALARD
ncbi:putative efflux pump channel domain protein, partial [Vibrio parahaemolyticus V-223/04]